MADAERKRAMKRLMFDQEELRLNPVENVSAAPKDENMFEWHCNFRHDDIIYHMILFLPKNYPYESPSAEFVPSGFRYNGGATKTGKKGTKVCLNIFSDFADIHTEWKNEKSVGWSPGYTVQTILLNVVAFLAETQSGDSAWTKDALSHNKKLSEAFTCSDCGHTYKKPFPSLDPAGDVKGKGKKPAGKPTGGKAPESGTQIIDYISKEKFKNLKPKGEEELFGYGLVVSGPPHRPSLTTPCEFLSQGSYKSMTKSVGKVHSVMKEELKVFLPLYINPTHGSEIKDAFESALGAVANILPSCKANKTPMEEMVLKTIPNLMCATVVDFSKGTQYTSDNSLNGYFALHRLLLWTLEAYPDLQKLVDNKLKDFIENENKRDKKSCPHIGEWLMLLSASTKYRWQDAADAYLSESWRRNVMWYVKDDVKLGYMDTDQKYRLSKTCTSTTVSRKILAFQILFLDIALPTTMSRAEIISRYDADLGFPTPSMVTATKENVQLINSMQTYADWFKVLKLKPWTDKEIFDRLVESLEFSINTDGYHWSFNRGAGGWIQALAKYRQKDWGKMAGGACAKRKAGGDQVDAGPSPAKVAAKERGRAKKGKAESDSDSDLDDWKPAKGRGRGRGKAKR